MGVSSLLWDMFTITPCPKPNFSPFPGNIQAVSLFLSQAKLGV